VAYRWDGEPPGRLIGHAELFGPRAPGIEQRGELARYEQSNHQRSTHFSLRLHNGMM